MNLLTNIKIKPLGIASYDSSFMMLGSCFAQNMGEHLLYYRLNTELNPFGILYNPASIASAINRLIENRPFTIEELQEHNNLHFSFMHHGSFSSTDANTTLNNINNRYVAAAKAIKNTNIFIITFGSAHIYELHDNVVSNCHKLPAKLFTERRLDINEISQTYTSLIERISETNPEARFIFSVSPVRYLGYGANYSQCNKASLLLACEKICEQNAQALYFPAYEIMMDELRDYRFYSADMIHPNEVAISYIWEKFSEYLFSKESIKTFLEVDKINKALNHRPLHPNTHASSKTPKTKSPY